MKILFFIPQLGCGGAEILLKDICIELVSRGQKVQIITLHEHHASFNRFPDKDILLKEVEIKILKQLYPLYKKSPTPKINLWQEAIENFEPDIIHSHLFEAEMASRSVNYPQAKWFSHCHDNMRQMEKISWKVFFNRKNFDYFRERHYLLNRYRANGGNQFIAISQNTFDYFIRNLPRDFNHNIHLIHNAINIRKFGAANSKRNLSEIRIINIGSFTPKKNQMLLLEVMRVLMNRGISAHLTFLGNGRELDFVKSRTVQYQLTEAVTFEGNTENVARYLEEANLYVHTAWYEPFGLVLLEAMAAGLPVIALDGKGNRDIMKDGVNGYLIEKQNTSLFADKIIELMSNESLYRSISRNAVAFAEEFDIQPYVDRLLKLYQLILDEK